MKASQDTSMDGGAGRRLPTATASREKMLPDVPKAAKVLERFGASDLAEMLFGEEARTA